MVFVNIFMSIAQYCVDTGPYIAPGTSYPVGTNLDGGSECALGPIRYLDVANNQYQIQLFNNWWAEQISQYGMQVNYYVNQYTLSGHDFFYGEQPLAGFLPPIPMVMCLTLNNDSIILSRFGIQGDADITAVISIQTFTNTLSSSPLSAVTSRYIYEPKAGDLIELSEYGTTRPNGRSGQIFEITERVDQKGGDRNQLLGHYIWTVKGKRYDYTYEPQAPREALSEQVYDNKFDGFVPLNTGTPGEDVRVIENKNYAQNIDKYSRTNSYNYLTNTNAPLSGYASYSGNSGTVGKPDTGVYGAYDDSSVLVNLYAGGGAHTPGASALGSSNSPDTYLGLRSPNN
jgi:hypothetical protein